MICTIGDRSRVKQRWCKEIVQWQLSFIGAIVMMDGAAEQRVDAFLERWVGSQGNERANYQSFLQDWCGALGVAAVLPKGGEDDSYCFDKGVVFFHKD